MLNLPRGVRPALPRLTGGDGFVAIAIIRRAEAGDLAVQVSRADWLRTRGIIVDGARRLRQCVELRYGQRGGVPGVVVGAGGVPTRSPGRREIDRCRSARQCTSMTAIQAWIGCP